MKRRAFLGAGAALPALAMLPRAGFADNLRYRITTRETKA